MINAHTRKSRVGVLLAAIAVFGALAAYTVATASADGRTLAGSFCTANHVCMSMSFPDGTFSSPSRPANPTGPDVTLRPGMYWLSLHDDSNSHNFALRSCPGSTDACTSGNPAAQPDEELTPLCNDPVNPATGRCTPGNAQNVIDTTQMVYFPYGTYRLFCQAPGHESGGMYVDISVGGVGQLR
jgi:hypothetical protein